MGKAGAHRTGAEVEHLIDILPGLCCMKCNLFAVRVVYEPGWIAPFDRPAGRPTIAEREDNDTTVLAIGQGFAIGTEGYGPFTYTGILMDQCKFWAVKPP